MGQTTREPVFVDLPYLALHREVFARRCLIIAGPSGVGKSTLAKELVHRRHDIVVLENLTTRLPRPDDIPGEMTFVSNKDFEEFSRHRTMFFERRKIDVCYGYPKKALIQIHTKRFILMFRSTGATVLSRANSAIPIVFPTAPVVHLHNIAQQRGTSLNEIQATIKENERLWSRTIQRFDGENHNPRQTGSRRWLFNDVSLPGSMEQLAQLTGDFLDSL